MVSPLHSNTFSPAAPALVGEGVHYHQGFSVEVRIGVSEYDKGVPTKCIPRFRAAVRGVGLMEDGDPAGGEAFVGTVVAAVGHLNAA